MKLNIYFKNVGQGDTIILDWEVEKGIRKFGLIDCNLVNNGITPVTQHIRNNNIKEFEFVVLSHPHSDHFSGFPKFFEYCRTNGIEIQTFFHTCTFSPEFLRSLHNEEIDRALLESDSLSSVNSIVQKKRLWKLFNIVMKEELNNFSGFLKSIDNPNTRPVQLTEDIGIRFLAPTLREMRKYMQENFTITGGKTITLEQNDNENNPAANELASFIQIYSDKYKWQVLLSSDSTKDSLLRIMADNGMLQKVMDKTLIAAQLPHHGSIRNHLPEFWKDIPRKEPPPLIISVGEGYGHPHRDVVEHFDMEFHSLHATNYVGGWKEYFSRDNPTHAVELPDEYIRKMPGVTKVVEQPSDSAEAAGPVCCEKHLEILVNKKQVSCRIVPPANY